MVHTKYKFFRFLQIEYVSNNYLLEFGKEQGLRSLQTHTSYEKSEFHVHCRTQIPRLADTLSYIHADKSIQYIRCNQDSTAIIAVCFIFTAD